MQLKASFPTVSNRSENPEICDDKSDTTLNTAELLPNIYENHQGLLIVVNIWPSVTNIYDKGAHRQA